MATPFDFIKNAELRFEVEDPDLPDVTDSAGNPIPAKKIVVVEAYLKPIQLNSNIKVTEFPGLGINAVQVKGYVTSNNGRFPVGVKVGDRTTYAKYRDQEGTFINTLSLQSQVKADLITGDAIAGYFQVLGGQ